MKITITDENALYPDKRPSELSPAEFLREFRHGRPDVRGSACSATATASTPPVSKRSVQANATLSEEQVRYIRKNYKARGKNVLAKEFGYSSGYIYKIYSRRLRSDVK